MIPPHEPDHVLNWAMQILKRNRIFLFVSWLKTVKPKSFNLHTNDPVEPTSAPCHSARICIQGATCSGILLPFQNKDRIIAGNKLLGWEGMTFDILKTIKEYLAIPLSFNYGMVTSGRD